MGDPRTDGSTLQLQPAFHCQSGRHARCDEHGVDLVQVHEGTVSSELLIPRNFIGDKEEKIIHSYDFATVGRIKNWVFFYNKIAILV